MFLLTLGVILTGFGYGIMQPIIYDKTASHVKPSEATFVLSLVMVMNYIAINHLSVLSYRESKVCFQRIRPISLLSSARSSPVVSVFLPFSVIIRRPSIDGQDKRPHFQARYVQLSQRSSPGKKD